MLGLIATRSISKEVPGIEDLVKDVEIRIRVGLMAYEALEDIKKDRTDAGARARLEATSSELGYALLLKKIRPDVLNATDAEITQAAWSTVPPISPLFWSFRVMVGLGFFFIGLFATAFFLASTQRLETSRRFLTIALISLPTPWIAAELGWYVAEVGRQPWVIEGVMPTFLAVSNIAAGNVLATLIGFVLFYSALAAVDLVLMIKSIRMGPDRLLGQSGRTPHELAPAATAVAAE